MTICGKVKIADLTKKGFDVTKPARDAIGTAAGEGAEFLIEDMYDAGRFLSPRYYGQKYDTGRTLSDAETRLVMQLDNTVGRSDPERIEKLKEKVFKETYGSDPVDKSSIQLAPGIMTGKSKMISKADGGRIGFANGGVSNRSRRTFTRDRNTRWFANCEYGGHAYRCN